MGAANQQQEIAFHVERVGVDTVSFAWRPTDDDLLWRRLDLSIDQGSIAGTKKLSPAGVRGAWMLDDLYAAARWLIVPEHRLIYAESRLASILSGDPADHSLGAFANLPAAASQLFQSFVFWLGCDDHLGPQDLSVRRLDLAADLRFADTTDGIAALRALAQLTPTRIKVNEWRHEGRTETIAYHAATKKRPTLYRIYDKGIEQRSDPAGALLRFERQHRWPKSKQQTVERFVADNEPEALWLDRFEAWAKAAERLVIGGPRTAQRRLIAAVEDGELGREQAERLAGALAFADLRGEGWWRDQGKAHLGRTRRRELAKLGLSLAPTGGEERELELGPAIRALRAAWRRPTSAGSEPASGERRPRRERDRETARAASARRAA